MKKLLFILVSLLIGIGFTLISLELFLRINPKFGYNYSSCNFKNKDMTRFKDHNFGYLRPSALLGYEMIPNCHSVYLPIPTNSYGLIGKEYKLKKEKNTFRILLLGDSIAWQDFSRQSLEGFLNSGPLLHSKYKFEIWNAGVPSYDVRRYYLYLKYRGLSFKPDMVVIFFFMNDLHPDLNIYYKTKDEVISYDFPLSEISQRRIINPFLMKHSFLYRFIVLSLNARLLNKKKEQQGVNPQEECGRYYLRVIKEVCEKNKIPLFIVFFPYLKPLDEYRGYQIEEYKSICKVIKESEVNCLNLYEALSSRDLRSLRDRKEDDVHPSREGHRLIATLIYNYLLDNFFNCEKTTH